MGRKMRRLVEAIGDSKNEIGIDNVIPFLWIVRENRVISVYFYCHLMRKLNVTPF
jgi:hypothetical protein